MRGFAMRFRRGKLPLYLWAMSVFWVLSSCSVIKNEQSVHDFYQLQALPTLLQDKVFLETLTFESSKTLGSQAPSANQDVPRTLLTQIETSKESLSLGAMTFSGLPVIQAKWHSTAGLVDFSSMTFDKNMVMRIIRDIQLVKWPEDAIKKGLLANYDLYTIKKSTFNKVREIRKKEQTLVTITYSANKITLINAIEHYQITLEQVNE